MIEPLAIAVTGVALLGCGFAVLTACTGRFTRRRMLPTLVLLELALVAQAMADLASLIGGHRPAEPGTHLAYLLTSVLVLPAALVLGGRDDDRWTGALFGAALLTVVVLMVRLTATWRSS